MNRSGPKDRKTLTKRTTRDDNQITSDTDTSPDARLVALVQFLARRAAERDFAQLIASSRSAGEADGDKGRIQ
jgi:hypothetical protein